MSMIEPYAKIIYGVIIKEDSCPPPWDEDYENDDGEDYKDSDGDIETYWTKHFAGPNNSPCQVEVRTFAGDGYGIIISLVDSVSYLCDNNTCYEEFDPTTLTTKSHWDCLLKNFCALANLKIEAGPGWFLALEY